MSFRTMSPMFTAILTGSACIPEGTGASGATEGSSTSSGDPSATPDLPPPDTSTEPTGGSTGLPVSDLNTATTTEGTTSPALPYCGDGVVDPGEECDLGADNSNTNACTYFCKNAVCGDGYIWAGIEACDMGWKNSPEYGGCALDCQWSARCGDGALDPEHEQCDYGPLNGTMTDAGEVAPCNAVCRWYGRIVFLSSKTYDGYFDTPIGADYLCKELAFYAGFEQFKSFRAWISDSWTAPDDRFEYTLDDDIPYVLLNGRIVAGDYAELVKDGVRTGISITEDGELIHGERVWTNTTYYGKVASPEPADSCAGWTSDEAVVQAGIGLNALLSEKGPAWETWQGEHQWTHFASQKCHEQGHLYCFEDGPIDP